MNPKTILSLDDFEGMARSILPRPIYGYVAGAVENQETLQDNRLAFADWRFETRVLRNVASRDQGVTVLGRRYASPFGIAPMGIVALSGYQADVDLAVEAASAGIPAIMSGASLVPMETVARAAPGTWFQAYLPGDAGRRHDLIARVMRAGFDHLVVTVDIPVSSNRENNIRSGFSTPLRPSLRLACDGLARPRWLWRTFLKTLLRNGMPHFENSFAERGAPVISSAAVRDFSGRAAFDWTIVDEVRRQWPGMLVIKGVLSVEDAMQCRRSGADAVILSNHGGRQLDAAISPMRILRAVRDAVGNYPVMVDGGFRRGTDVLKALALGADLVFVGRPFNYAAAVGGAVGVRRAIQLLRDEVDRNQAMLGMSSIAQLVREVRLHATPRH
jgi:L-lactate dehydrogenase (cytochrome)